MKHNKDTSGVYMMASKTIWIAYRQGGDVPDLAFKAVEIMIGKYGVAICKYVGRLMEIKFLISPRQPGLAIEESGIQFRLVRSDEDDTSPMSSPVTLSSQRYYSSSRLEIILPDKPSPMSDEPSVISVIESMDKEIQPKKFDLDEEVQGLSSQVKLFTISIVRPSLDK